MTDVGGMIKDSKETVKFLYSEINHANAELTDEQKCILTNDLRREILDTALDTQLVISNFKDKYVRSETFLDGFQIGTVALISTTYEKLPKAYQSAHENGDHFMTNIYTLWKEMGKYKYLSTPYVSDTCNKVPDDLIHV